MNNTFTLDPAHPQVLIDPKNKAVVLSNSHTAGTFLLFDGPGPIITHNQLKHVESSKDLEINGRFGILTLWDRSRRWFINLFNSTNSPDMGKEKDHIELFATEDGKLYIKPSDLFSQKHVQEIIEKMANSPVLGPKKVKAGQRAR